jgi:putative spermidine/putrescine transport system permease protein
MLVSLLAAGLGLLLWYSLHSFDPFLARAGGFTTDNYRTVIESSFYRTTLVRTILLSSIVTVIAVLLALPFAYAMVRSHSRFVRLGLLVVAFVPFLTGEVVRAYGWLILVGRNGVFAWIADAFGLNFTLTGTAVGVVIALAQIMMPLCALILLPAVRAIDVELEQAAATLGARPWRVWFSIILPLARPGLAGAAAAAFALSMTSYAVPYLVGAGFQDFAANVIHQTYFFQYDFYLGSALGFVVLVIVSIGVGLILWSGLGRATRTKPRKGRLSWRQTSA